jgi:hypothetical protein
MLQTTLALSNSSVSGSTACATSTISWSTVSMPGTVSRASAIRALSRPAAMNGMPNSRRYSQTSRPV